MIVVQSTYQISDQVKIGRLPNRSAIWPNASVPTQRPAKVENTNVPNPATLSAPNEAKKPSDSGVNRPE